MRALWLVGAFIFTGIILSGCLRPEEFPPEPVIGYKSFEILTDSAKLTITFQDGDGDIGLEDSDTTGAYHPSNVYHYNLFAQYWEKDDALGWVHAEDITGTPIEFRYRTPVITPTGQNKALKGEIEVTLEPLYFNPSSSESDTIMYKIMLVDRALNESNWVESDVIIR